MALKAYLPPAGPQNTHGVPYRYLDAQGAHRVGRTTVPGPESVILTADEDGQREIERFGLAELDAEDAEEALDAYNEDDTEAVEAVVADYRDPDWPVLDGTVPEIEDVIATGRFDGDLDALDEAESDDEDRKGVHEAIADRREVVSDARTPDEDAEDGDADATLDTEGGTSGAADAETLDSEGGTRGEDDDETLDTEGDGGAAAPESERAATDEGEDEEGDG